MPRDAADDGADSGGEGGEEGDGDASIIVDPSVTFIEAPEREILNRLVCLPSSLFLRLPRPPSYLLSCPAPQCEVLSNRRAESSVHHDAAS